MFRRFFEDDVDRLNRIADSMPDSPVHTLEYWENGGNPYVDYNLSDRDLAKVQYWMAKSENLPDEDPDPTANLSFEEKELIGVWMAATENLPLNYTPKPDLYDRLASLPTRWYDRLCAAKYNYDLQVHLGERDPWWAAFVPTFILNWMNRK